MRRIPAKKAPAVAHEPALRPSAPVRASRAFAKISIMDTYTMTPAEKPRAAQRKALFVRRENRAARLPMPVERPARRVRPKANPTPLSRNPFTGAPFVLRSCL